MATAERNRQYGLLILVQKNYDRILLHFYDFTFSKILAIFKNKVSMNDKTLGIYSGIY